MTSTELANVTDNDGFGASKRKGRIIRGAIIKDADGRTTCAGEVFPPTELVVINVAEIAQCWVDDQLVDSCVHTDATPVDIDELNSRMPKPWKKGLDGQPRPPWAMNCAIYFLRESDGSTYTLINSTIGTRIAYETLCDKVEVTRRMRNNPGLLPVVVIDHAIMKTRYGLKQRPEFRIVGWKGPADDKPVLKAVAPPTAAEMVDDEIPDHPIPKKLKAAKAKSAPPEPTDTPPWEDDFPASFGG